MNLEQFAIGECFAVVGPVTLDLTFESYRAIHFNQFNFNLIQFEFLI